MVFYVEKLPFKGTGTPNTQCLLVWKDLGGSELNKDKHGERAEGFGIRGAMCHFKLEGHLAVFYKGTRLLSILSRQPSSQWSRQQTQ